jgi:hypothetical protein
MAEVKPEVKLPTKRLLIGPKRKAAVSLSLYETANEYRNELIEMINNDPSIQEDVEKALQDYITNRTNNKLNEIFE